jgi:3-hydroxybutyrate dehydrogenase
VVIADLNKRGADAAAAELGGAKRAIGVAVDVTDEAATANCVAQAVAAFGGVDILVSNAGIQTVAPIDQFDFGKWKLTTRAALREMYKNDRGGSIIYVGWCIPRRHPCSRRRTLPPNTG